MFYIAISYLCSKDFSTMFRTEDLQQYIGGTFTDCPLHSEWRTEEWETLPSCQCSNLGFQSRRLNQFNFNQQKLITICRCTLHCRNFYTCAAGVSVTQWYDHLIEALSLISKLVAKRLSHHSSDYTRPL